MEEKTCSGCKDIKEALQGIEATLERMEAILQQMKAISAAKHDDEIYEKCGTVRSFA